MKIQLIRLLRQAALAAGLSVIAATSAFAQSSATTDGTATATIIRPITLAAGDDLAFGNVVPGASLGTIVISTAGTASVTGGVTRPGTQGGTISAASFDVGGEGSFTYTITLPASAATITHTNTTDTMTVGTWTASIGVTAGALSGSAGSAGTETFTVGGTLNVGANQVAGVYSGTFAVTVAYN